MGLKTLKDILSPDNDWDETSEAKCGEAVRQEAIKWVKDFEDKIKNYRPNKHTIDWNNDISLEIIRFIKHFFNLTDEEISNG